MTIKFQIIMDIECDICKASERFLEHTTHLHKIVAVSQKAGWNRIKREHGSVSAFYVCQLCNTADKIRLKRTELGWE